MALQGSMKMVTKFILLSLASAPVSSLFHCTKATGLEHSVEETHSGHVIFQPWVSAEGNGLLAPRRLSLIAALVGYCKAQIGGCQANIAAQSLGTCAGTLTMQILIATRVVASSLRRLVLYFFPEGRPFWMILLKGKANNMSWKPEKSCLNAIYCSPQGNGCRCVRADNGGGGRASAAGDDSRGAARSAGPSSAAAAGRAAAAAAGQRPRSGRSLLRRLALGCAHQVSMHYSSYYKIKVWVW